MTVFQAQVIRFDGEEILAGIPVLLTVVADPGGQGVLATYDRTIHASSLLTANFSVPGLTLGAVTQPSSGVVRIATSLQVQGATYTLTIASGIQSADLSEGATQAPQSRDFTGVVAVASKPAFQAPHWLTPHSFHRSGPWGTRSTGARKRTF